MLFALSLSLMRAPPATHAHAPRAAVGLRMQEAAAAVATPTLSEMEQWTREYYGAARDSRVRGDDSMDEFLTKYDWFADDYVLTGPDIGPLCKADYLATQRGFTLNFGDACPDLDYLLDGFHLDPGAKRGLSLTTSGLLARSSLPLSPRHTANAEVARLNPLSLHPTYSVVVAVCGCL